jgi:hypothetical protein
MPQPNQPPRPHDAKTPKNTQEFWRLGVLETWRLKVFSKKERICG